MVTRKSFLSVHWDRSYLSSRPSPSHSLLIGMLPLLARYRSTFVSSDVPRIRFLVYPTYRSPLYCICRTLIGNTNTERSSLLTCTFFLLFLLQSTGGLFTRGGSGTRRGCKKSCWPLARACSEGCSKSSSFFYVSPAR